MSRIKCDCVVSPTIAPQSLVMPKPRRKTFIKEWREFRKAGDAKFTQEELAHRAGMSAGNLSLLERGLISYTQDTLERLADALDCDPVDLLTRNPFAQGDEIFDIARRANAADRRQLTEVARVVLKGR